MQSARTTPALVERDAFAEETPDAAIAQRAQREAVVAFNRRLEEQEDLLATIFREQMELAEAVE